MENADLPLLEVGTSHPPFQPRLIGTLPAAQGTLCNKPWHGIPNFMVPNLLVERAGRPAPVSRAAHAGAARAAPRALPPAAARRRPRRLAVARHRTLPPRRTTPPSWTAPLIVAHNCRLPWSDGKQDGYWAPVVVRSEPGTRHAESILGGRPGNAAGIPRRPDGVPAEPAALRGAVGP